MQILVPNFLHCIGNWQCWTKNYFPPPPLGISCLISLTLLSISVFKIQPRASSPNYSQFYIISIHPIKLVSNDFIWRMLSIYWQGYIGIFNSYLTTDSSLKMCRGKMLVSNLKIKYFWFSRASSVSLSHCNTLVLN